MRKPIYEPRGAAGEYSELALNIYTGCTNGCEYCFAPGVLRKTREEFGKDVTVRDGLLEALECQLSGGGFKGRTVHLCFTCDPYPVAAANDATRDAIWLLKDAGCHVQILTKNPDLSRRDWDLLDGDDWLGITYTGDDSEEPHACPQELRLRYLELAHERGIRTWVSIEPVLDVTHAFEIIAMSDYIDMFKVGKLNHRKSDIDWAWFGRAAEALCQKHDRNYVIKDALREEMDAE